MIRLAAVGDLHCRIQRPDSIAGTFAHVAHDADLLLLTGDLTDTGHPDEARLLAAELATVPIPVAAVLGNHDYEQNAADEITEILSAVGVSVLEGTGVVFTVRGSRIGVAGTKGFGGGFYGACGTAFGEPEMKAFMGHTHQLVDRLDQAIVDVREAGAERIVVLTHYSPIRDTLRGEKLEIFPFLGSYLLAEPLDRHGVDLALHGHAHVGQEYGMTPGGVPVRNVAKPVLGRPYAIYSAGSQSGQLAAVGYQAEV